MIQLTTLGPPRLRGLRPLTSGAWGRAALETFLGSAGPSRPLPGLSSRAGGRAGPPQRGPFSPVGSPAPCVAPAEKLPAVLIQFARGPRDAEARCARAHAATLWFSGTRCPPGSSRSPSRAVTSGQEETCRRRAASPLSPVQSGSKNGLEETEGEVKTD